MTMCPFCSKPFIQMRPGTFEMCSDCSIAYDQTLIPRLTLFEKLLVSLFRKVAEFLPDRAPVNFLQDGYRSTSILRLKFSPLPLKIMCTRLVVHNQYGYFERTEKWEGGLGEAYFGESDWFIMPFARKIFHAFETLHEVEESKKYTLAGARHPMAM